MDTSLATPSYAPTPNVDDIMQQGKEMQAMNLKMMP